MDRRTAIKSLGAAAALSSFGIPDSWAFEADKVITRPIPSSGEQLPCVGVGTWQTFDVGKSEVDRAPLYEVLKIMLNKGGSVIDSSPMYGRSEGVVGDLTSKINSPGRLFMATKVWTTGKNAGIQQMEKSMKLMRKPVMDLMQIHNLVDWKTHLKTLRDWKESGKIRYLGITHYTSSAYEQIEQIMKTEPLDFLQINYSINARKAEERLLPLAQDKGIAVIINRPYGGGSLFNNVRGRELPEWSYEFGCKSWGNFFLKYILGHEAVTCVIPGTGQADHMIDNMWAGVGKFPSVKQRVRMKSLF